MLRFPMTLAAVAAAFALTGCSGSKSNITTGVATFADIAQATLTAYSQHPGANPKVVTIGNEVLAGIVAVDNTVAANGSASTEQQALAGAATAMQQAQQDDPNNATLQKYAALAIAGLQAPNTSLTAGQQTEEALVAALATYIADQTPLLSGVRQPGQI